MSDRFSNDRLAAIREQFDRLEAKRSAAAALLLLAPGEPDLAAFLALGDTGSAS